MSRATLWLAKAAPCVAVISTCLVVVAVASAIDPAPRLRPHRRYGGVAANHKAFVNLLTASATKIASSPANTAPELGHSNINLTCTNGSQVNTGMPAIALTLNRGHYSFSTHFVRHGVKEYPPTAGPVTLTVKISGTVKSSSTIAGTVKITGPGGCSMSSGAYTAKLQKSTS
jgi:hypothetical protein